MTSGMSATVKGLISDVRMSEHMGSDLGLPEAPQQIQRNLLTWLWTLSVHCYGAMNNQGPVDERHKTCLPMHEELVHNAINPRD